MEIAREYLFGVNVYLAHLTFTDYKQFGTYYHPSATASQAAPILGAVFLVNGSAAKINGSGEMHQGVIPEFSANKYCTPGLYDNKTGRLFAGWGTSYQNMKLSALRDLGVATDTLGFGNAILRNGEIKVSSGGSRRPRTFIGTNEQPGDIWVCVAEGDRVNGNGPGLTHYECAEILKQKGCTLGFPLDGGGSSTMVYNGKVLNSPSEGAERGYVGDFIFYKGADMNLKPWQDVIRDALSAARSKKYKYFYGAKNVLLTDATMDALIAQEKDYFSRYSSDEIKQIKKNSKGFYGLDCSAFTGWICTGDKSYSLAQIGNCRKYNTLKDGPTASLLFTTWGGTGRHIGLDIGNGYCLQCGWESTDKIEKSGKAGIFLSKIGETAWEKSGESSFVNYTGVYSPYEPTTEFVNEYYGVSGPSKTPKYVEQATTLVNVRTGAGANYPNLPEYPRLGEGNKVDYCDQKQITGGALWHYVRIAGKYYGWVNSKYLKRV